MVDNFASLAELKSPRTHAAKIARSPVPLTVRSAVSAGAKEASPEVRSAALLETRAGAFEMLVASIEQDRAEGRTTSARFAQSQ